MSENAQVRTVAADLDSNISPIPFTMKCSSPPYDITCTLAIYQHLGTVHIKWSLPEPYVFSKHPQEDPGGVAITLFANGKVAGTLRTLNRNDQWDTQKPWGSGWSAMIANWDYQSGKWLTHARTPETKNE